MSGQNDAPHADAASPAALFRLGGSLNLDASFNSQSTSSPMACCLARSRLCSSSVVATGSVGVDLIQQPRHFIEQCLPVQVFSIARSRNDKQDIRRQPINVQAGINLPVRTRPQQPFIPRRAVVNILPVKLKSESALASSVPR